MKKGRLIFVPSTRHFITVDAPNKRARKPRAKSSSSSSARTPSTNVHSPASKSWRKGTAIGLHYLLAAIEFVETA